MQMRLRLPASLCIVGLFLVGAASVPLEGEKSHPPQDAADEDVRRLLYVAVPGMRRYLEHGGHGLLVFDIDDNYRFVKRIPVAGRLRTASRAPDGSLTPAGEPSNVKGIAVSLATNSVYISNLETMQRIDLASEQIVWEHAYEGGADRMAMSPDGNTIYLPSLEKDHWHVVDADTGGVRHTVRSGNAGAHNTIFGLDGRAVYLGGLRTNSLGMVDPQTHRVIRQIGPLGGAVRPFTINGAQTLAYINVNGLLGFEIADIKTGALLHRIDVTTQGFAAKAPLRHGVFSHGVGLTPDETEVWVVDGANQMLHVYDNTVMPPVYRQSITLRKQPGWISFSLDGRHAFAPTGEIIDVATKKVIAQLVDETGALVKSEKMVEVHMSPTRVAQRAGDQFGVGRVTAAAARSPLRAQGPDVREMLVVGEKSGALLAIIDPQTLEIVARVPANPHPHEVATDGRYVYVSNSGARAITVIDLQARTPVEGIDLGPLGAVHGLWFASGRLYFANEGTRIIGRYDPATRQVDWVLGTGRPQSHMIVTSRDGQRIFTTETGPGTATLLHREMRPGVDGSAPTQGDWVTRVVPTGGGAEGLDLSPDERELWVTNVRDRTLSVIDVAAGTVVHTIQLPTTYANRLKFTPDGRHVLVADLRGREVIVYDAGTRREVRRIDVGGGSEGMQMTPDGRRAFVAVSPMNKVAVVDLATFSVVAEIPGLNNPDGMSWVRLGGAKD